MIPLLQTGSLYDARMGDVLATRATGFAPFAWMIWLKTNGPWNHIALPVGKGQVIEAVPPRVSANPISEYEKQYWVLFRPVPEFTQEQKVRMLKFLEVEIGKPYDWRAIRAFSYFGNNKDHNDFNKWFCSELARAALEEAGEQPVHRKPRGRTPPEDLVEWERLQMVACRWPKELREWLV